VIFSETQRYVFLMKSDSRQGGNVHLSVITATFNAADLLPRLVASLQAQTDQSFEWVVADGGSSDATLGILADAKTNLLQVMVSSQPDFGIYDALNRAVKLATGDYYLVLGADDTLAPDAIANYKQAIAETQADLITAQVQTGANAIRRRVRCWRWLYGPFAYVSGHAVGLVIRRNLHQVVGYYSRSLPIAADQLFILKAIQSGARVSVQSFLAGYFEPVGGTSGQDVLGTLLESYRVQLALGESKWVQTVLLMGRLIKNWRHLGRGL
jgi:glycosyltransferase involved in cell wall biosynthesis